MRRAVVDTNVLVSAVILPGSQLGKILFHIRSGSFTLLYHSATLAELVRVLESNRIQKRFQPTSNNIQTMVELIVRYGELTDLTQHFTLCRDPKDDIFLDIAFAGHADVIVSGDKDLLALHPFGNISVVTPREFLQRLSEA